MSTQVWEQEFSRIDHNLETWLTDECGVTATPQRLSWARDFIEHQAPVAIQNMARAIITGTSGADYLQRVTGILQKEIPIHLLAGEKSNPGWDVPMLVRDAAASYTIIPTTGHLMMLENPVAFCQAVEKIVTSTE